MKVLSVRRPWSHAIIYLGKDIENRPRRWSHRGRIAIQASLSCSAEAYAEALAFVRDRVELYRAFRDLPRLAEMTAGAIIGTVELVDCVENERDEGWAVAGAFGLVLRDPRPLARPLPWKGALCPTEIDDGAIARAMEAA